MSTLIRVRGRQGNMKQKAEELFQEREQSRVEVLKEREEQAVRLSYLESLPIEILQNIFLLSRNPSFPSVSRRLRTQTLSEFTKVRITTACFRAAFLAETSLVYSGVFGRRRMHHSEIQGLLRERRDLCSLTRQSWFNFPLLQAARYQWLLETAAAEVEAGFCRAGRKDDLTTADKLRIREKLRSFLDGHMRNAVDAIERGHFEDIVLGRKARKSSDPVLYLEHGAVRVCIGLSASHRLGDSLLFPQSRTNNTLLIQFEDSESSKKLAFYHFQLSIAHVPPWLFRAPFTQAKGDLLDALMPELSVASFFWDQPQKRFEQRLKWSGVNEAYELGLEEALNAGCMPALMYLLNLNQNAVGTFDAQLAARFRYSDELSFDQDTPMSNPLGLLQTPADPYWQLPWTYFRRPLKNELRDTDLRESWPTTRHFQACIANFERGPAFYLVVLLHLINSPGSNKDAPALPSESLNQFFALKNKLKLENREDSFHSEMDRAYQQLCQLPVHKS